MFNELTEKYPKTLSFAMNLRLPQLLYHGGLVLVGFGLGFVYSNPEWTFNIPDIIRLVLVILAAWTAWATSVVINDVVDIEIDRISNPERPLPRKIFSIEEYLGMGTIFFFLSIILAGAADWHLIFFILLYQLLAFVYSAWPLRLKRIPLIATLTSALASVIIAFCGFVLISPDRSISGFPLPIFGLLIAGYALALPMKDFKDFEGDKKDGVYTIPVILGIPWGKVAVGGSLFFSYMLSVAVLDDFRLFWWAFGCGLASFALIMNMKEPASESRLHYRNIFWWMIVAIIIYLLAIIFLHFV